VGGRQSVNACQCRPFPARWPGVLDWPLNVLNSDSTAFLYGCIYARSGGLAAAERPLAADGEPMAFAGKQPDCARSACLEEGWPCV
jgi:hypothetical protein